MLHARDRPALFGLQFSKRVLRWGLGTSAEVKRGVSWLKPAEFNSRLQHDQSTLGSQLRCHTPIGDSELHVHALKARIDRAFTHPEFGRNSLAAVALVLVPKQLQFASRDPGRGEQLAFGKYSNDPLMPLSGRGQSELFALDILGIDDELNRLTEDEKKAIEAELNEASSGCLLVFVGLVLVPFTLGLSLFLIAGGLSGVFSFGKRRRPTSVRAQHPPTIKKLIDALNRNYSAPHSARRQSPTRCRTSPTSANSVTLKRMS